MYIQLWICILTLIWRPIFIVIYLFRVRDFVPCLFIINIYDQRSSEATDWPNCIVGSIDRSRQRQMAGGGFVEDGFFTCLASKQNADRRRRHGLEAHDTCWLCDQEAETVDHLRVNCSFAKVIWWNLLSWMDCSCSFQGPSQLHTWWEHLRGMQGRDRRRGFDSLFMCIIWAIWKERNKRLFEGTSCTAIGGHTSFELFKARVVRGRVGLLRLVLFSFH